MTRWDVFWVRTYLGTRSSNPTEFDYNYLLVVLLFLKFTAHYKKSFGCNSLLLLFLVDAANGLHIETRGHSGIEIRSGKDCIICKSSK